VWKVNDEIFTISNIPLEVYIHVFLKMLDPVPAKTKTHINNSVTGEWWYSV